MMITRKELCPECYDGDNCGRGVAECPLQRASAIEAGIPVSVIDGRAKLTDYYSREQIRREARVPEQIAEDEQDMIDAGRGHLVRR
jgi:hypothetical protein